MSYWVPIVSTQGISSLSGKMSCPKISLNLEAVKYESRLAQSPWNLMSEGCLFLTASLTTSILREIWQWGVLQINEYRYLRIITCLYSATEAPVWGVELNTSTVVTYVNVTNRSGATRELITGIYPINVHDVDSTHGFSSQMASNAEFWC